MDIVAAIGLATRLEQERAEGGKAVQRYGETFRGMEEEGYAWAPKDMANGNSDGGEENDEGEGKEGEGGQCKGREGSSINEERGNITGGESTRK